jgi:GMP synthase (glutamine-hydrolysing)
MATEANILIVDMGSQYTRVIERRLRENGFRSAVLSPAKAENWMAVHGAQAVIVSGGDKSVYDEDAPQVPQNILEAGVPILGICYGMQWLAHQLGGTVERHPEQTGFGPTKVDLDPSCDLFQGIDPHQTVWASHGDSVTSLPESGYRIAQDGNGDGIKAMQIRDRNMWGVQFHPEVADTPCGGMILRNFVENICGRSEDWSPADLVTGIRSDFASGEIRAIHGFSGGVDSTVAAAVLAPVLGDRLHCICIDAGHLREGEVDEVKQHAAAAGVSLTVIEAEGRFFEALAGISDSEEKREAFKRIYNAIFLEEAAKFGATHIVQGTLATDIIESGATGGAVIKSHHNVGLDWKDLQDIHPLSSLFKYEVRALAEELGLPPSVIHREPFPGPGLFLRMPGIVTKERRDIIRWADKVIRNIVREHPDYPEVSQLVIHLNGTPIVGVKGDARVYAEMVVVRPVKTIDFMTASSPIFTPELMDTIMTAVSKHRELVGVLWDFNPKPPRTTEAE